MAGADQRFFAVVALGRSDCWTRYSAANVENNVFVTGRRQFELKAKVVNEIGSAVSQVCRSARNVSRVKPPLPVASQSHRWRKSANSRKNDSFQSTEELAP